MGMSTHVIGFKPPDDKWRQMKAVWDSCKTAGVDPPDDVDKFFDYRDPDPVGVEIEIDAQEWGDDSRSGFQINLADVPKDVRVIRFYNSW